jgi:hypothetical protein
MARKKGAIMNQMILHIILIALVFSLFFLATVGRVNSRAVKQQIMERQIALLIESAEPGDVFIIKKGYPRKDDATLIDSIELSRGAVKVSVDGLKSVKGYGFFSRYEVIVEEELNRFYVRVLDE